MDNEIIILEVEFKVIFEQFKTEYKNQRIFKTKTF